MYVGWWWYVYVFPVHACACTCLEARGRLDVLLYHSPPDSLETESLTLNLELGCSQQTPMVFPMLHWGYRHVCDLTKLFTWVLEIQTQIFALCCILNGSFHLNICQREIGNRMFLSHKMWFLSNGSMTFKNKGVKMFAILTWKKYWVRRKLNSQERQRRPHRCIFKSLCIWSYSTPFPVTLSWGTSWSILICWQETSNKSMSGLCRVDPQ